MADPIEPRLSLTEWLVLCVAAEKPAHGFAIAAQLGRGSKLGAVCHVARPQVYRCLERLAGLGLICELGRERSSVRPVRQVRGVTPTGGGRDPGCAGRPAIAGMSGRS
jgi:DNA-binding PadR family transcriptional regulator